MARIERALQGARRPAYDAERNALEKRSQAEDARWDKQKHKLEAALRWARET